MNWERLVELKDGELAVAEELARNRALRIAELEDDLERVKATLRFVGEAWHGEMHSAFPFEECANELCRQAAKDAEG